MLGPREILSRPEWRGQLVWHEHGEARRRGHRLDLAGRLPSGELLPIEIELTEKSPARLGAVLCLCASWIREQRTPTVIYVCGTRELADRVERAAKQVGLTESDGTIRIELLEAIRSQAVQAVRTKSATTRAAA